MQTGGGWHGRVAWALGLLGATSSINTGRSLQAQSCAGMSSRLFSLSAVASTSSEERTLGVAPGIRLGPGYVRLSAARLYLRAGLGWDDRYGASLILSNWRFASPRLGVCPMLGAHWTERDGARASEVRLGMIASRRLRLPGRSGRVIDPIFSLALHRQRVRFDSVALAGEDYTRYDYADLFGVAGVGLSLPVNQHLWLRGMLEVPAGAVAQHASLSIEVAFGFGGKRQHP